MNKRTGLISTSLALALVLSACGSSGTTSGAKSYVSGNGTVTFLAKSSRVAAPEMQGMTLEGRNYSLKTGTIAVVNVWASWCAPCRAEAPTLAALSLKYPKVSFVGILTRDNISTANAFIKRFNIPYPTLKDDSILLGFRNSLIANAIPSTVIIDKDGKVAGRISGEVTVASLTDLIDRVVAE